MVVMGGGGMPQNSMTSFMDDPSARNVVVAAGKKNKDCFLSNGHYHNSCYCANLRDL